MKRMMLLFAFFGMLTVAMADWTYGTARFTGSQPSSCLHHGTVMIWYNGSLSQTGTSGGVDAHKDSPLVSTLLVGRVPSPQ